MDEYVVLRDNLGTTGDGTPAPSPVFVNRFKTFDIWSSTRDPEKATRFTEAEAVDVIGGYGCFAAPSPGGRWRREGARIVSLADARKLAATWED